MDALQQELFQVEKHEELICSICEHIADCYLKEMPPYPITEDLSWCDYNTLCSRLRRYMLDKYPEIHGEKSVGTNCLSDFGRHRSELIANIHRDGFCEVFTLRPYSNKHIAPIQTATNVCTLLQKNIHLCEKVEELPFTLDLDTVIIWHHSEMTHILKHFGCDQSFIWPEDNFTGCLLIQNGQFEFKERFLYESDIAKWTSFCCSLP